MFHVLTEALSARDLPQVVGTDARFEVENDVVRLKISLSKPVPVTGFLLQAPNRAVFDLPGVNFQLPAAFGRKEAGFVSAARFGLFTPDRARIVMDLSAPAVIISANVQARRGGLGELTIELRSAGQEDFRRAVADGTALARSVVPSPAVAATPARVPTIVIDPGHGGIDAGATTAGVMEKQITLAFGHMLKKQLESSGGLRVLMTRDDDRFVSLSERVRLAREAGAELFISIHADSLSAAQEVRGATIYTGSERATDAESARLAAKENEADALAGAEASETAEGLSDILMDLTKRETRSFSGQFARNLVESLGGSVRMHRIPLRSAGFRVLTAPDVPSVLIELGYMSSQKDIELLTSDAWRAAAAASVQAAVKHYLEKRGKLAAVNGKATPAP
ncbi:MAG: N-acetylmuramoyl-L-alanine amidase [Bosea sp. (in: a-proteobacteria)]